MELSNKCKECQILQDEFQIKFIFRRAVPSKLDTAPKGVICKVNPHPDTCEPEWYIQRNINEEDPIWEKI